MPKRPWQETVTMDDELGQQLEDTANANDMSKAEFIREGIRRQLQAMEVEGE